ncbi:uncharacterized protein LOC143257899 [Tachypleus tridentatus]|uniref:uncharacterized protein LOC143257899 n=1 Tax=Tachypleus tridentatus TaxID=6853 RepID=UPI003FCF1336
MITKPLTMVHALRTANDRLSPIEIQHSWLEYSVTQDAAFCFACRLFSHTHFKNKGCKDLTYCTLDASHAKTVEENRHYIRAVIDALLYIACQNESQRGHREGNQSDNMGNFLELLDIISRYDEIVKKKMSGPGNAKYTHHDIQNELLDIIAGMTRKDISKEVMEAEHFALMVDETKDMSKQEQLFIVIRCGIDHNACIGQCYDGAAVMSGHISGVQDRFRREVSQAVYVHCYAHKLNLVLVDCVHNIQAAAEFFVTIQKLYKFFSTPVVHEQHGKTWKSLLRIYVRKWEYALRQCVTVDSNLPPRHLDEFITTSSTGQRDEPIPDTRIHTFYAIIDSMLNELNRRFSSDACSVLMGATALNPKHSIFLDKQALLGMAANYSVAEDDLTVDVHQLNRLIARKKDKWQEVSTPLELATMLEPYKDAFMDLHKLVCIAVTLPVTSAACERSFSCLKLLKTYLCNSSGNNRTSNLTVISVNFQEGKTTRD